MKNMSLYRSVPGFLLLALAGCGGGEAPPLPTPDSVPTPNVAEVESVVFLLGDAGDAYLSTSPTLARLQQDIEWWAANLENDSSVAMIVLGDIRYPEGVRPETEPEFPSDTAVVLSQVRVINGPAASARGAIGYFLPGNHDWGLDEHWEGYVRLLNLQALLGYAQETLGANVHLVPAAGTGGPHVVDWGEHLRFLLLDTAWWILEADDVSRARELAEISAAMETAGNRDILFAGHHPFKSAGSHGGGFQVWRTLGLRWILHRAGAILEDLTSIPYREFEVGLRSIFARLEPPLFFVGGHDHSLQVIVGTEPTDPLFNLVSGSGSKLTGTGEREGVVFAQEAPGYMRLVIEKDGDATLFVEATGKNFLSCPASEPARTECMAEGIAAFRTLYWREVR